MGQSARTLSDLRLMARSFANELVDGFCQTNSIVEFDLTTAVQFGYEQYARDTKCFPISYTLSATPDQAVYPYSDFGTSGAGARMFEVRALWYNQQPLEQLTLDELDRRNSLWRFDASGTPAFWVAYGESQILFHHKPGSAGSIFIEGWETPDLDTFSADTDEPTNIHVSHRELIAYAAALRMVERIVNQENNLRYQYMVDRYKRGITSAHRNINTPGGRLTVVGGRATPGRGVQSIIMGS